ncbi:unnamed protein product [Urochloa humidicola]
MWLPHQRCGVPSPLLVQHHPPSLTVVIEEDDPYFRCTDLEDVDEEIFAVNLKKGEVTKGLYQEKPDAAFSFTDNGFPWNCQQQDNLQIAFILGVIEIKGEHKRHTEDQGGFAGFDRCVPDRMSGTWYKTFLGSGNWKGVGASSCQSQQRWNMLELGAKKFIYGCYILPWL